MSKMEIEMEICWLKREFDIFSMRIRGLIEKNGIASSNEYLAESEHSLERINWLIEVLKKQLCEGHKQ